MVRKATGISIVLSFALCLLLTVCLLLPTQAAFAALPDSYTDAVQDGADWYFGEDYLNVSALRELVNSWKSSADFDFSVLENDPVVIAVIDTGINETHDIFGSVTSSDGTVYEDVLFRDADGTLICKNTIDDNSNVSDGAEKDGHGTHVSGIIAALIHALDLEKYIKIMPIKAGEYRSSGSIFGGKANYFTADDIREGIEFALANGADIVNMSLAADISSMGAADKSEWVNLVTDADAEKALFVAAAGNSGTDSSKKEYYPGASPNVVGVMNQSKNVNGKSTLYSSSNYGAAYDICAPGYSVISADGAEGAVDTGYRVLSGTSMSSPVVAFAAALLELKYTASPDEGFPVTPDNIRGALRVHTADFITKSGCNLPVLDLPSLVGTDYRYDDKYGVFVLPNQLAVTSSADTVYTGENVELSLSTVLPENAYADFFVYEWTYSVDGKSFTAYGKQITKSIEVFTNSDLVFRLDIKLPTTHEIVGSAVKTVKVEYFVPSVSNSTVLCDAEVNEEGGFDSVYGEGVTFSLDKENYTSPNSVYVWYVNGKLISRSHEFVFNPPTTGTYTITLTVDGNTAGRATVLNVYKFDRGDTMNAAEIAGYTVLGVTAFALVVFAVVMTVKYTKKKISKE